MLCAFAPDGYVVVANKEVAPRSVWRFASRVVGEDDGDGRCFKSGHAVRALAETRDDAIDAVAHGVGDDVRRKLVGVLHVPDFPGVSSVHEVEHA